jgi:hypothetical protein
MWHVLEGEMHTTYWSEKLKGRDYLEDQEVGKRVC